MMGSRNSSRLVITLYAVIGLALGGLGFEYVTQGATNHKVTAVERNACARVNVLRAQSNLANITGWRAFAAAGMTRLSQELYITALTNCEQAIAEGTDYRYPAAEPIGDPRTGRLTPSAIRIEQESLRAKAKNTR